MTESVEPSPEPSLPGRADADGWRRLHPLSPLLRGGIVFLVIVGIVIANFRDRLLNLFVADRFHLEEEGVPSEVVQSGDIVALVRFLAERGLLIAVIGSLLGIIVLVVAGAWVAWHFSTFRVTDAAVESRRGMVFRTHRRAPLERIQSVNLQRPLFARALGLTKIDVVTAGQGGKVELAYLGYRDAQAVREQILDRATVQREAAENAALPREGSRAARAAEAISARAEDFIDADIDPRAIADRDLVRVPVGRLIASIALSWEAVSLVAAMLVVFVGGAAISPGILFAIIPLILIMIGVMIGQFNRGFNFTLSRGADAARIGSGLTSTTTETIPFGRIHAVEARQPLFWRPLGWWKVRVTTAGHSVAQAGQNGLQNVVLPVGDDNDVLRVIEALLPGVADEDQEIAGLKDGLDGVGEEYLGAGPRAAWLLWWGRRRAGMRVCAPGAPEATFRVRRGALTRSFAVMPILRAQSVEMRRPLIHRMLGLASVQAHTVLGPIRMEMRGVALADARRMFGGLAAEVLRVQGADAARRSEGRG